MNRPRPSQAQLRRHFRYDPVTGKLYWRRRAVEDFADGPKRSAAAICNMWNARFAGKEAFPSLDDKGYHRGFYDGRLYRAHQIVWAMQRDEWPPQIDHRTGNRSNNRIGNLRPATAKINACNRKRALNNTSGVTGVYPYGNRWRAQIGNSREGPNYLGTFKTKEEAVAARKGAAKALKYHRNHGRPA